MMPVELFFRILCLLTQSGEGSNSTEPASVIGMMTTVSGGSPLGPITRPVKLPVTGWIIGILAIVMSVALLGFVCVYGGNVPYLDDWDIVPALTGHQAVTLEWLWSQHNEHRLPVPKLLLLGLYKISGFDFRAGMVFNAAALILMAALMLHAAARIRGGIGLTDAFIPLLFLGWAHYDNLLWSWQVGFVSAVLLAILALHAVSASTTPRRLTGLYMGILVCALPLTGAVGLAFAAPLAVWMINVAFVYRRRDACLAVTLALGGLLALLLIGLYFIGYHGAAIQPPHTLREWLAGTVDFLSMGLAPMGWIGVETFAGISVRELVGYAVAGMLLAALLANLCVRRSTSEFVRASGLGAIVIGALVLALGVAWGRGGQCVMPRYVTLGTPGLMAVYLSTLIRPGSSTGLCARTGLLLLTILTAWPNVAAAYARAADRLDNKILPFELDVERGLPPMILADHYSQPPKALYPRPRQDDLAADIRMLKGKRIGLFRNIQDDPPFRMIGISPERTAPNGVGWYSIKEEQQVYAIQVSYQYRSNSPGQLWAVFHLAWLPRGVAESQAKVYFTRLPLDGRADRILVWINEPLGQFHISPDDANAECRIEDVQLLVKP
jgi:hypothetical protein